MLKHLPQTKKILTILSIATLVVVVIPSIAEAADPITDGIISVLWSVVVGFFGKLVWMAGILLNVAIGTFVVGFGELYESTGLGFSIDNLWSTVRDIFNLTFIFGLVFIGFKMIFNSSDSNARRMLGSLILAALLVNFSLFITKFIIDFSNIAATQLAAGFMKAPGVYAVSDGFVNLMGLTGIWGTGPNIQDMPAGAGFAYVFGSLILYLVTAFVFAAGGILLIIRFVVLNIYMVLSPLMFLGWVFPGFSGVSREYWSGFMSRAFFAPAYILMVYFAHQILVNMKDVTIKDGALATAFLDTNAADAQAGFISTIPYFIITSAFLVASIVIAQKMGSVGATNAIAIGRRMSGKARQYATNTATYIPRATSRMATNAAGEKLTTKFNNLQTGKGWGAAIARTNVVDRATRGTLDAASGARFGTGTTNKAERDYKAKTTSRANQTAAQNTRTQTFETNFENLTDSTKMAALSVIQLNSAIDDLGKSIREMSKDEKNDLSLSQLTNKSVAINLSDDDIKNIESSGKFSAAEVANIKNARKHGFRSIATHGNTLTNTDPSGTVTGYSVVTAGVHNPVTGKGAPAAGIDKRTSIASKGAKEVGNLPIEIFKEDDMYAYITPAMLEERMRNGISPSDLAGIKAALHGYIRVPVGTLPSSMLTANDPWVKWEKGNSVYAAQFFA